MFLHGFVVLLLASLIIAIPVPDPIPTDVSPRVIMIVSTSITIGTSFLTCGVDATEHPECKETSNSVSTVPDTTLTPATTTPPGQLPNSSASVPPSLPTSQLPATFDTSNTSPTVIPSGQIQSTTNNNFTITTTILPGQSTVTISAVPPIFLGSGGLLVFGSSTTTIPSSVTTLMTIGGHVFTISPEGMVVGLTNPNIASQATPTFTLPAPAPTGVSQLATPTLPTFSHQTSSIDTSVTSTMTTVPSGFSTEMTKNTLWTTNTWVTTTRDGAVVVVPVLVGCPGCGGAFGGIILWNLPHLPDLPRISFNLPGFPNLPKFRLPCVKFLGMKVGDCNDPPSTESGTEGGSGGGVPGNTPPGNTPPNGNTPPPVDPTPEDKEDEKDDDPEETPSSSHTTHTSTQSATSTSQSSGTTTSTSTSSSSSTCSQVVASSCIYSVICQPGQSGNQCPTITQGCQTSTACSMTGTTEVATATAKNHVIHPLRSSTPMERDQLGLVIKGFFPSNPNAVRVVSEPYLGTLWWEATLTEEQKSQLRDTKLVSTMVADCEVNCPTIFDEPAMKHRKTRKRVVIIDQDVQPEMTFFNWEPPFQGAGRTLASYGRNFSYDDTAGNLVPVYIIDSGANLNSPEFPNFANRVRWIQGMPGTQLQDDTHPNYHGTCMLSKIAGLRLGIAKRVSPIIVRMASNSKITDYINALTMVSNDLGDRPLLPAATRAILSMSYQYPTGGTDAVRMAAAAGDNIENLMDDMARVLRELEHKGVFAVTGSGNGHLDVIHGIPAMLTGEEVPSLLVVGATKLDGSRWWRTWGIVGTNIEKARDLPHVWAPGYTDMLCAGQGHPGEPYKLSSGGTSAAAASVAGLAAYFLALPSTQSLVGTPALMKTYIISKAWQRPAALDPITDMTAIMRGFPLDIPWRIPSVYNNYKTPALPVVESSGLASSATSSASIFQGCSILASGVYRRAEASECLPSSPTTKLGTGVAPTIPGSPIPQTQSPLISSLSPPNTSSILAQNSFTIPIFPPSITSPTSKGSSVTSTTLSALATSSTSAPNSSGNPSLPDVIVPDSSQDSLIAPITSSDASSTSAQMSLGISSVFGGIVPGASQNSSMASMTPSDASSITTQNSSGVPTVPVETSPATTQASSAVPSPPPEALPTSTSQPTVALSTVVEIPSTPQPTIPPNTPAKIPPTPSTTSSIPFTWVNWVDLALLEAVEMYSSGEYYEVRAYSWALLLWIESSPGMNLREPCWKWEKTTLEDENPEALAKLVNNPKVFPLITKEVKLPKLLGEKENCTYKGSREKPGEIKCGTLTFNCEENLLETWWPCEPQQPDDQVDYILYSRNCIVISMLEIKTPPAVRDAK